MAWLYTLVVYLLFFSSFSVAFPKQTAIKNIVVHKVNYGFSFRCVYENDKSNVVFSERRFV